MAPVASNIKCFGDHRRICHPCGWLLGEASLALALHHESEHALVVGHQFHWVLKDELLDLGQIPTRSTRRVFVKEITATGHLQLIDLKDEKNMRDNFPQFAFVTLLPQLLDV